MDKTMLVLLGKQSTGKTQTLKALISRLGQFPQFKCVDDLPVKDAPDDRLLIFTTTALSGREVKVAVLTAGDAEGIIKENLDACLDAKVDIIVCACRMGDGKHCWDACKDFADKNQYGLNVISNISTWHDGRKKEERPLSPLYPFWDAYSAEALLLAVMHLINEAKEE